MLDISEAARCSANRRKGSCPDPGRAKPQGPMTVSTLPSHASRSLANMRPRGVRYSTTQSPRAYTLAAGNLTVEGIVGATAWAFNP